MILLFFPRILVELSVDKIPRRLELPYWVWPRLGALAKCTKVARIAVSQFHRVCEWRRIIRILGAEETDGFDRIRLSIESYFHEFFLVIA